MTITKAVVRTTVSLLCAVLILNGIPLHAAGPNGELRHEAFMRGGKAIEVAFNAEAPAIPLPAPPRAIDEPRAAVPPVPMPAPQDDKKSGGMSKLMWATLIGGFVAGGAIIYWVATGPGASIRNCSTCQK